MIYLSKPPSTEENRHYLIKLVDELQFALNAINKELMELRTKIKELEEKNK